MKFEKIARADTAFKNGLEVEASQALKRFKQLKAINPKTTFRESEGQWKYELYGDYAWKFPGSNVSHWHEVKNDLSRFHITGTQDMLVLAPLIKGSNILEKNDKLIVQLSADSLDKECQRLLKRKYSDNGAYPIYEDGNTTILSSELFKFFATDGVGLYQSPKGAITIDDEVVKTYNIEDRRQLERIVRKVFQDKKVKADLWYGR